MCCVTRTRSLSIDMYSSVYLCAFEPMRDVRGYSNSTNASAWLAVDGSEVGVLGSDRSGGRVRWVEMADVDVGTLASFIGDASNGQQIGIDARLVGNEWESKTRVCC